MRTRTIAITAGDINGIGPEVVLKAVMKKRWLPGVRFVVIGPERVFAAQAEALRLPRLASWTPAAGASPPHRAVIFDPTTRTRLSWKPGCISTAAARAASEFIQFAAQGCRKRLFHAMVTAPISKQGFHKAGITVPGHTEMLASLTRTRRFAMMLLGGGLRVVIVTRHIPLSAVPATLSRKNISEAIRLTAQALPWLGVRRARIGVCGLNPHAGEGGDIGSEEQRVITPAIRAASKQGLKVSGPVPADTIFYKAVNGAYDAVVAMYHDQGLAPLKMLAFEKGVNLTLGLPIVRTSPDHGTAFDLAGQGKANPSSMVEAIRMAADLARRRNPWSP